LLRVTLRIGKALRADRYPSDLPFGFARGKKVRPPKHRE